jgi:hypothetical protein
MTDLEEQVGSGLEPWARREQLLLSCLDAIRLSVVTHPYQPYWWKVAAGLGVVGVGVLSGGVTASSTVGHPFWTGIPMILGGVFMTALCVVAFFCGVGDLRFPLARVDDHEREAKDAQIVQSIGEVTSGPHESTPVSVRSGFPGQEKYGTSSRRSRPMRRHIPTTALGADTHPKGGSASAEKERRTRGVGQRR